MLESGGKDDVQSRLQNDQVANNKICARQRRCAIPSISIMQSSIELNVA